MLSKPTQSSVKLNVDSTLRILKNIKEELTFINGKCITDHKPKFAGAEVTVKVDTLDSLNSVDNLITDIQSSVFNDQSNPYNIMYKSEISRLRKYVRSLEGYLLNLTKTVGILRKEEDMHFVTQQITDLYYELEIKTHSFQILKNKEDANNDNDN